MSLGITAVGTLATDPQARTAANGKSFATATLRVLAEGESIFVSIIAFSETAVATLLVYKAGDVVSVTGLATLSKWVDRAGEEKHGLKMVASRVQSPHMAARQREKISKAEARKSQDAPQASAAPAGASTAVSADGELADDVPF
jgi:single-stranded DNA-binding protein